MFERLIAFNAGQFPQRVVLAQAQDSFTFARMAEDIGRCANWLATLDLPPEGRALLHIPHPYAHWIVTLGLEQHGLVTASTALAGQIASDAALLRADLVFSSQAPDQPVDAPVHLIDQPWIDALARQPAAWMRSRPPAPQDPCRIIVTSGTTGVPKKILLTRAMIDERIQNLIMAQMYASPDLVAVSTIGVGSVGGFLTRLRCWAQGGAMYELSPGSSWAQDLATRKITLIRLAPFHLQGLLRELPEDFAPQPGLTLGLMGGSLSSTLAAETRRRLTANIVVNYGSAEAGTVAIGRLNELGGADDAAGFLCPWAEIEVLGPDGARLPPGQVGELRLRAGDLAGGYLDDPAATAEMFRDGWFWPGDLGVLSPDGLLKVVGRTNELLNIGGAKFLASRLEALVLQVEGVSDAGVFLAPDADGLDIPHIAYVAAGDLDLTPLKMLVARALGSRDPQLMRVTEIPRNAMAKIQRDALRDLHAASQSSRSSDSRPGAERPDPA